MARMLWTQRQDIGPPMGWHVRMAYDEKRRVIILVCQDIPEPQTTQTWLWDGELWVQVADTGPSKTDALVWDAKREMLVATTEDSLWEWSGTDWTQVSDQVTGMGTSAFRHSRGRLIRTTFKENSPALTWEWNDGAWTQIDDMGPPKRAKFDLVYDVEHAVTLLVAGAIYSRNTPTGFFSGSPAKDTWAFDGRWKAVADFGPSPRWEQASAYDSDRNCVVLFGGTTVSANPPANPMHNDTWEWNGVLWRQVEDMGPSERAEAVMAYDKGRKRCVLFGGHQSDSNRFVDTWEYYDHD
jgi:hypothetical protein